MSNKDSLNMANLSSRIFNEPLLMSQGAMVGFLQGFSNREGLTNNIDIHKIVDAAGNELKEEAFLSPNARSAQRKPYDVHEGIAIISVSGTLVNKNGYVGAMSGVQGYDGLEVQYMMALDDPDVHEILFDMDSGGGEVAGCFDFCDLIYEFRSEKPTTAFVGERAHSACYAIASACQNIAIPRTGACGSVGVLTAHQDISGALDEKGVKITLIYSGDHKVDGNPFESLPENVQNDIQSRIDATRDVFASTVARNRGMTNKAVLDTQANIYVGKNAVEIGFADKVMSFKEVLEDMSKRIIKSKSGSEGTFAESDAPVDQVNDESVDQSDTSLEQDDASTGDDVVDHPEFGATEISAMCDSADATHLTSRLIAALADQSTVEKAIAEVKDVRNVLVAASFTAEQISVVEKAETRVDLVRATIEAQADEDIDLNIIEEGGDDEASSHDYYGYEKKS